MRVFELSRIMSKLPLGTKAVTGGAPNSKNVRDKEIKVLMRNTDLLSISMLLIAYRKKLG